MLKVAHKPELSLPVLVFGVVELRRLSRELDALEDYLKQNKIRQAGKQASLPHLSRMLDSLATQNQMNLLHDDDRHVLGNYLKEVEKNAPVLHFSFASDPSSAFMAKLVTWLRRNIHPHALVTLGLQPSISAGCILRTANKSFDFSLRHKIGEKYKYLTDAITQSANLTNQEVSRER
jgi:F0F1-type ATP synthase delta subunit